MIDDDLHEAEHLSRYVGGLLAGKGPMVQAAVLAELTAIWLHGHRADTPKATLVRRREILKAHTEVVRKLVDLTDEESP